MAFVQIKADIAPTVMLRHNGMTTFYQYNEVQQAVNAAVDGDTIYLTDGTFEPFIINKRILLRGNGETTMVNGNCEVNIIGTTKLTMPVLDAISFAGDVIVRNAYEQFTLRKCQMKNLLFEGMEHHDVKLSQCYITNRLHLTNNVHEFNVFNSKIQVLYPHDYIGGATMFEHCYIYQICDTIQGAIFNSSAINETIQLSGAKTKINLVGCILNSCTSRQWIEYPPETTHSNYYGVCCANCVLTDCSYCINDCNNYFASNNNNKYISSLDGTPIGAYGGQHPYSRAPELPTVTKYQFAVDPTPKKMHVNFTVTKP